MTADEPERRSIHGLVLGSVRDGGDALAKKFLVATVSHEADFNQPKPDFVAHQYSDCPRFANLPSGRAKECKERSGKPWPRFDRRTLRAGVSPSPGV